MLDRLQAHDRIDVACGKVGWWRYDCVAAGHVVVVVVVVVVFVVDGGQPCFGSLSADRAQVHADLVKCRVTLEEVCSEPTVSNTDLSDCAS